MCISLCVRGRACVCVHDCAWLKALVNAKKRATTSRTEPHTHPHTCVCAESNLRITEQIVAHRAWMSECVRCSHSRFQDLFCMHKWCTLQTLNDAAAASAAAEKKFFNNEN